MRPQTRKIAGWFDFLKRRPEPSLDTTATGVDPEIAPVVDHIPFVDVGMRSNAGWVRAGRNNPQGTGPHYTDDMDRPQYWLGDVDRAISTETSMHPHNDAVKPRQAGLEEFTPNWSAPREGMSEEELRGIHRNRLAQAWALNDLAEQTRGSFGPGWIGNIPERGKLMPYLEKYLTPEQFKRYNRARIVPKGRQLDASTLNLMRKDLVDRASGVGDRLSVARKSISDWIKSRSGK